MFRLLAVTLCAACGFTAADSGSIPIDADLDALPGSEPGDPDAPIDASFDAPPALSCHGTFETVCLGTAPQSSINISGGTTLTINTDSPSQCRGPAEGSTLTSACILAANSITIDGTLRATGSRPLILISIGSFALNGNSLLDVGSRGTERGAGARVCTAGGGPGGNAGGNGGSYGSRGGQGGAAGIGSPGSQQAVSSIVDLGGGCNGFAGGGAVAINRGAGGLGGGTVLVIATAISLNGNINACGGGGSGGVLADAGGGGGGSGGAIVLDTQNLMFNGGSILAAQGGGGGEGASTLTAGAPGTYATNAGSPAAGGRMTNSQGGDGGDGGVSSDGSNGGSGNDGGGGGGGGTGYIRTTDGSFSQNGVSFPPIMN